MRRSSRPRKTANLSGSVHQQLNMYALAASAAGVGVLALAQPAEAKIVYTKADVVIGGNGVQSYNLDLNHDGITDFTILFKTFQGHNSKGAFLGESAAAGNGVIGTKSCSSQGSCTINAAALYRGAKIAPGQAFYGGTEQMVGERCFLFTCKAFKGDWANVTNRYLGLKFKVKGKTHYGWARLSVQAAELDITATLTGYAYETIPNTSIIAGRTKGAADERDEDNSGGASLTNPIPDTPQPAALGTLALGAQGVPLWRREESELEGN